MKREALAESLVAHARALGPDDGLIVLVIVVNTDGPGLSIGGNCPREARADVLADVAAGLHGGEPCAAFELGKH